MKVDYRGMNIPISVKACVVNDNDGMIGILTSISNRDCIITATDLRKMITVNNESVSGIKAEKVIDGVVTKLSWDKKLSTVNEVELVNIETASIINIK